jgi:spermidine/putrescine transport system permease protein
MRRRTLAWTAPAWAVILVLFAAPLAIVCAYSLLTRGAYGGVGLPWTIESYVRLADPLYIAIVLFSLAMAAAATVICAIAAFPLAWLIARAGDRKHIYLVLIVLPFWTSFLIRTYAWMFLLRDTGLINTVLLTLGVIVEPLPLLYNHGAVLLGLVYGYFPFMVLPLYAAMERIDPALLEAAADLGARPATVFRKVVLPLAAPGLRAGSVLVFIPCFGAYLTPDLLGGGRSVMVGNLVQNQFTSARDWPFGSAVSLAIMALITILLLAESRRRKDALL